MIHKYESIYFFINTQLDFRVLISILFLSSSALGSISLSSVSEISFFWMIYPILLNILVNFILSSIMEKSIPIALLILIIESTLSFL